MKRYLLASVLTGLLFGVMDGLIHGNPYGTALMECFRPIAKEGVNITAGIFIDLFYGFVISGIYSYILPALSTQSNLLRGLLYGAGMWFFRVLMMIISYWMLFGIPNNTLLYLGLTGLAEMLILGLLNAWIIQKKLTDN